MRGSDYGPRHADHQRFGHQRAVHVSLALADREPDPDLAVAAQRSHESRVPQHDRHDEHEDRDLRARQHGGEVQRSWRGPTGRRPAGCITAARSRIGRRRPRRGLAVERLCDGSCVRRHGRPGPGRTPTTSPTASSMSRASWMCGEVGRRSAPRSMARYAEAHRAYDAQVRRGHRSEPRGRQSASRSRRGARPRRVEQLSR